MFDITNALTFYEKLLEEVADLQGKPDSAHFAVNYTLTATICMNGSGAIG
jgi:hypothetical protein